MAIEDDDGYFARKPWFFPVLIALGMLSLAVDIVNEDLSGGLRTAALYSALICLGLFHRTGSKTYKWAAFGGFVVVAITILVGIGLKKGWW